VAEALVEDDLDGDAGVGAGQHDDGGVLAGGELLAAGGVLVRVGGLALHETMVSFEQMLPDGFRGACHTIHPARTSQIGVNRVLESTQPGGLAAGADWRDDLVAWFRAAARDLPWREPGTSPWGILVSEVMSQQTPVARVAPSWRRWMGLWPEHADLAAAPADEVLREWGKLGYPRRALRLRECAAAIVAKHDDRVPADVKALLALPGIGDYTARAV